MERSWMQLEHFYRGREGTTLLSRLHPPCGGCGCNVSQGGAILGTTPAFISQVGTPGAQLFEDEPGAFLYPLRICTECRDLWDAVSPDGDSSSESEDDITELLHPTLAAEVRRREEEEARLFAEELIRRDRLAAEAGADAASEAVALLPQTSAGEDHSVFETPAHTLARTPAHQTLSA